MVNNIREEKLQAWGRIAGFQKQIIDQVNALVIEHHRKTLSNAHPGSIYRTTAFLLMELFGDYFCKAFNEYFQIPIKLNAMKMRIRINGSNYIETGFTREKDSGCLPLPQENIETQKGIIKIAELQYQTDSSSKPENQQEIEGHFEDLMPIMSHAVTLIEKECILIAKSNQNVRNDVLKSSYEVFEREDPYVDFFSDLLKNVTNRYKEAQNIANEEVTFQVMLFLPIRIQSINSYSNKITEPPEGIFFYPYFNPNSNPKPINDNQRLSLLKDKLKIVMNCIFYTEEIEKKGIQIQDTKDIIASFRALDTPKQNRLFTDFCEDFFNDYLIEVMADNLIATENDKDYDAWFPDNISALVMLFEKYMGEKEKCIYESIEAFFKDQLCVKSEVLDNCFQEIRKLTTPAKILETEAEIRPWDIPVKGGLSVFQPAGEGIVGYINKDFIPLRIRDQKYKSLIFPERIGVPYNVMGFLEGRYGHGGGDFPVALIPLTANGQLLGTFYAVKEEKGARFSTNEMNTMEFLSTYVAKSIQEAKDTYIFKKLEAMPKLNENDQIKDRERKMAMAIASFVSSAAIVTNVQGVEVIVWKNTKTGSKPQKIRNSQWATKPDNIITPTLLKTENSNDKWDFIIPPQIWNERSITDEYWILRLTFFEPEDIIDNYKNEIEKLYRTILHILGLKASGTDISEGILKEIGSFTDEPETQKKFHKEINAENPHLGIFFSEHFHIVKWEHWSCSREFCRVNAKIVLKALEQQTGDEKGVGTCEKSFLECLSCWWEHAGADNKKKAKIRALLYGLVTNGIPVQNVAEMLNKYIL